MTCARARDYRQTWVHTQAAVLCSVSVTHNVWEYNHVQGLLQHQISVRDQRAGRELMKGGIRGHNLETKRTETWTVRAWLVGPWKGTVVKSDNDMLVQAKGQVGCVMKGW